MRTGKKNTCIFILFLSEWFKGKKGICLKEREVYFSDLSMYESNYGIDAMEAPKKGLVAFFYRHKNNLESKLSKISSSHNVYKLP